MAWLVMQVVSRLAALYAAGLWHGRLSAETSLLRGPASVQLLGACSTDTLQDPGQQPLSLCSKGHGSLEGLTTLWCARKVSLPLERLLLARIIDMI